MKQLTIKFLILICVLFATTTVGAQTNLLLNGQADFKTEHWRFKVNATVEEFNGGKVFVLRNGGHLQQLVQLTDEAIGKYALFIGLVSSERANVDGKSNTNLPHLYVFMLKTGASSYGKTMRGDAKGESGWQTIYTTYQVTKEDVELPMKCFLYQGEKQNVPNDGSAVRFDNLGLYLFETEKDALEFADAYK